MALVGYYMLNHFRKFQLAKIWLIGMSLWFYGYFNASYLAIICVSIVGNYLLATWINRLPVANKKAKWIMLAGVVLNIASIFYFKYFDFFASNFCMLIHKEYNFLNIVLPLGISFFTFQQVSFLIDTYKGETKDYGFVDYALFVVFFPQLIAGPIVLHKEMIPQFADESKKKLDDDYLARGLFIFAVGLFKKVLIADTFGLAVAYGFDEVPDLTSLEVILISFSYTFQLYFDFSGYCDMATGIASMFHIDLPQNFDSPYKATSARDFWGRWHMTLTRFLTYYVYIPLGGNRKGKIRTYLNIMIVYLVSGLWHGANWTFVVWGLIHGVAQCIDRLITPIWQKIWVGIRWVVTFIFINCTWILFRANSLEQGFRFLGKLTHYDRLAWLVREEIWAFFDLPEFYFLEIHCLPLQKMVGSIEGFHCFFFLASALLLVLCTKNCAKIKFKTNLLTACYTIMLLVWAVLSLSGISTFLYFNF